MEEPSAIDYEGLDIPAGLLVPPSTSVSDGAAVTVMRNGLTVMVKEDHTFPIVSVTFGVPMGSLRSGPGMAGLAEVTSGTMLYGTEELGYAEFHGRLESRGAAMSFRPGREYATGSVSVLSEDIDVALRSVSDLLTRPAMRAEDFTQVLEETRAEVEQSGESVFAQGMENLSALLFGSREAAGIPTMESLEGITVDDARHFQQACCRPASSVIAIVGDVDPDAVLARAEELFGTWSEPNTPLPEIVAPVFSTLPGDTSVVTMAGRAQAGVYLGLRGPGYASTDYLAFTTMNGILGSGIGSRLGHYVRDDQGLAYAVGSYLSPIRDQGLFMAYLSTKSDFAPRAAGSVTGECTRMADEPVDAIELQLEQASSAAGHALSFADYGDQADYLVSTWMKGLPMDWDRTSLRTVLDLTTEDIRSVARRYFGTGEWFFSFAGGLDADLRPLGQ
jgi:zinc protease